jgi:hypothetical protein
MKTKRLLVTIMSIGVLALAVPSVSKISMVDNVYAKSIDNDLKSTKSTKTGTSSKTSSRTSSKSSSSAGLFDEGSVSSEDLSVGDFISNHRGMTSEQLSTASQVVSPITNIFGYISGGIVALVMAGIFLITALDLLYISIPPVRPLLYTPGTDGTGAMTAGRGGFGGYGGMQQGNQGSRKHQWVSDEAVQCAAMLGGSSGTEGMGMMNRGGMGYGAQPQSQMSKGSVIKTYLIKRAFFMVLLAVCVIILMSSALLGTGVNLANWGLKILDAIKNVTSVK